MPLGPGKYDDLCTDVRLKAEAEAAIVIIINGKHGHGFSCQANILITRELPTLLENVARELRRATSREHPTNEDYSTQ